MKQKYKHLIEEYCLANGIAIPPGFARNSPSQYVVIRTDLTPPKLVATTWFKKEDVVYYLQNSAISEIGAERASSLTILDFKTGIRLHFNGTSKLVDGKAFTTNQAAEPMAGGDGIPPPQP